MANTLSGLAKKNNGFAAPGYSIVINKTDIPKDYLVDDFRLELTSGYEASGLSFTVKNGFEGSEDYTAKLNSAISGLIKPGNVAEASVGYGAEKAKLFLGYIDSIYIDYGGSNDFRITVECLDAKGIMMNSRRSEVKKDVKRYSEAVKGILDAYPKLITNQTVEQYAETSIIEQHNESDYDFIVRIAEKINYSFYIISGEAVFAPVKSQSPAFSIAKNDLLKSFSLHMSLNLRPSEVVVRSGNEAEPSKPFEGKAKSYKSLAEGSDATIKNPPVIPGKTAQVYIDHSVSSEDDATKLAIAQMSRLSRFWADARLECVGAPELLPGKTIRMEGFGNPCDGKYYIKKTTHIIYENSYVTQCELGADAI